MRVNLYTPFADPWRQSMRVYAGQLARALRAEGPDDRIETVDLPGARLLPPARYWDQYVRYQWRARGMRADVHHVLDHGFAHLAAAWPAGRAVVTFHDAIPLTTGGASRGTRLSLMAGIRLARRARARFVAVSHASARDLAALFDVPSSQIDVVPNGVDPRFAPAADRDGLRARLGLSRPTVLIVGHTQPYMNVDGALAACASAVRAGVDLEVVKIGAPLTRAQADGAASRLAGRVRETGIVSDAALREWYGAADALVYLPRASGFGLPVLEAMASGMPVVASSTGAVAEIATDAAWLADPDDPDQAGLAIARAVDAAARAGMIVRGLARAAEYSWARAARETLRVYRKVADAA